MISESFLQELKDRSDIESIVSSYVRLRRGGRTLTGLCPFHSEKTASFHVYTENQSFYCFGCGAGGDVITFVCRAENLDYVEAVKFLADRAGLRMPEESFDDSAARLKTRVLEINRESARYFHANLIGPKGRFALDYLRGRGLTDKTIRHFGLGAALDDWHDLSGHLREKGYTEEELISASVAGRGRNGGLYDLFRNRAVFPIIDLRGNVIAFGGRLLSGEGPKYLNSGDTAAFKKSRNLFALNFAKGTKRQQLLLAEGYMDVVSIHQAGFDNAVATLGTSLTEEQCRLIAQYTDTVVLSYDADSAGQNATTRAVNLLSKTGLKIKILKIPGAKDPDEFIRTFGPERFQFLIEGASNSIEFEIGQIRSKYHLEIDDERMNFLKEFAEYMQTVQNPIERDIYLSKICSELGVSKDAVLAQITSISRQRARARKKREERELKGFPLRQPGINDPQRRSNIKYAVAEERLIALLVKNPDFYPFIAQKITPAQFVTDTNRQIFDRVCDRLSQGLPVDLTVLSASLDSDAVSRMAGMLAGAQGLTSNREEAEDCIRRILEYHQDQNAQKAGEMDDDSYYELLRSIAAKKK